MNKLVLFDIDGTIIKGKYGHAKAFSDACKIIYGLDIKIDWDRVQGMTDQEIISKVLAKEGLNEEKITSRLKEFMGEMVKSFQKTINMSSIEPIEGVVELLEVLNKQSILIGLVTGNLESIARAKLKKVGLDYYFKVGGFGSDDIFRADLIRLTIKRARENFNFKFHNNVFLFGDTPQDIKAGKEAGVKTIGVATGVYSKEQLENTDPDFVLINLKDKNKILEIIGK